MTTATPVSIVTVPSFTSSAVSSISDVYDNDRVDIVFTSSDTVYTYRISDVDAWQNDLIDTITEDESVGRFVNRAVRSGVLQLL
jgi:hypothetical protein